MPKIVYADMLPIPGRGRICSVVLDEWPEGLKTGDRLLVGGIEFDYEIEHLSFRGPVDLRPHPALMLRDEEIGPDWFIGKEADRARPQA